VQEALVTTEAHGVMAATVIEEGSDLWREERFE
jgi:hypothetical protein